VADQHWWTEERIAELRHLLTVEGLSAKAAARVMGTTKNSIVGKARRVGIAFVREPFSGGGWDARMARREQWRAEMKQHALQAEHASRGCRFIAGEPKGVHTEFCGADRLPGKSWCAEHHRVVFVQKGTVDHDKLENWLKTGPILPRDAA
jgi:hypothetical protein